MSSFFTCFPSSATLATTNILESAGGHTQVQIFFIIFVDDGQQVKIQIGVWLDVPTAVRLVHQPGGSDRPTADWTALLFPTKGALTVISLLQV